MRHLLEEEKLHAEAIAWLSARRDYRQIFEDPDEATKARLDSIGVMAEQPCFIEVKTTIGPAEARHIESKISGSLRGHATPSNAHPQFAAMRSIWDGRSPPLIATVARRYTADGLEHLTAMLAKRSRQWVFEYEVMEWTGSALQVLASGSAGPKRSRDPSLLVEDVRIEPSARSPNATLEKLRDIAAKRGVLELFDYAINTGRQLGFKLDFRTDHVTLTPIRGQGWLPVLPAESSPKKGLVLDCVSAIVPHLQGLRVARHGRGRFSYHRISVSDVETLEKVLKGAFAATETRSS